MVSWFKKRSSRPERTERRKVAVPEGLWVKCNNCGEISYSKEIDRNLKVCPKCDYHFRITARERIDLLVDQESFEEFDSTMESMDPLHFKDSQKYTDRLKKAKKKTGLSDAVVSGVCTIGGQKAILSVFDFFFMGGSMGSVVGEKVTRAVERAVLDRCGLVIVSSSGGARMQEGALSLMQMAKSSGALARLRREGLPYISILTDPTTGGVTASFAMLGDVNIAEPRALIGFAGPRVIEQTIRQELPDGFQRSEFLLKHGMVDCIISRKEIKTTVANLLAAFTGQ
ncbi:MAG TPA: acetyl-CoA carboxylase carboxyltransferase subunit beta [Proteobacteria bacterium]|nr:acetyl-coenzyme A carboxylase carboxyl transferase subunit beta [bacterium BMS3Abin14]HDL53039.1 acetyl-CoA carboxylase carboxyltransferase subunit beta [Pseudomonadota bacterium]